MDRQTSVETVYLGTLPPDSRLARFLSDDILERELGVALAAPLFDIHQIYRGATVLRYTDRQTGVSVVGKFFARKSRLDGRSLSEAQGRRLLQHEFDHLRQTRALGIDHPPYQVVRPLGILPDYDALLIEEFVAGDDLRAAIQRAAHQDETCQLQTKLDAVAGLLATLHQRTRRPAPVAAEAGLAYLAKVIDQLSEQGVIDAARRQRLHRLGWEWQAAGALAAASQVLIHGDATPGNLLFRAEREVVAIDLERMRPDDCAVDLGCVAAELKHWFLRYTHDPWAGEWAIDHLYNRYRTHANLDAAAFAALTRRGQFYMGSFLLRISRNAWLDMAYRRRLALEGELCLQY